MPLACDWQLPVEEWSIPWPGVGPYSVDSWDTSYTHKDGSKMKAYRVIGKSGFQLHVLGRGCVIQFDEEYAKLICEAANKGLLKTDPEKQRERPR